MVALLSTHSLFLRILRYFDLASYMIFLTKKSFNKKNFTAFLISTLQKKKKKNAIEVFPKPYVPSMKSTTLLLYVELQSLTKLVFQLFEG